MGYALGRDDIRGVRGEAPYLSLGSPFCYEVAKGGAGGAFMALPEGVQFNVQLTMYNCGAYYTTPTASPCGFGTSPFSSKIATLHTVCVKRKQQMRSAFSPLPKKLLQAKLFREPYFLRTERGRQEIKKREEARAGKGIRSRKRDSEFMLIRIH